MKVAAPRSLRRTSCARSGADPLVAKVFVLDASVLISALSPQERDQADSKRFLETLQSPDYLVVMPTLVRAEVASGIARLTGNEQAALTASRLGFVPAPIVLVNVDESLIGEAAEIAATCRLGGADSVYVAVARRFEGLLVTLDGEQRERSPKPVVALRPGDLLQDSTSRP